MLMINTIFSYTFSLCFSLKMFKFNSSNKHTTNSQTDKDLKEEGNRLFSYKQYEKAIECYNKAIVSIIGSYSLLLYGR